MWHPGGGRVLTQAPPSPSCPSPSSCFLNTVLDMVLTPASNLHPLSFTGTATVTSCAKFPKLREPAQTLCLRPMRKQLLDKFLRCVTGILKPASARLNSFFVSETCNSSWIPDPVSLAYPNHTLGRS